MLYQVCRTDGTTDSYFPRYDTLKEAKEMAKQFTNNKGNPPEGKPYKVKDSKGKIVWEPGKPENSEAAKSGGPKKSCTYATPQAMNLFDTVRLEGMERTDGERALLKRVYSAFREFPSCAISGEPAKLSIQETERNEAEGTAVVVVVAHCLHCN